MDKCTEVVSAYDSFCACVGLHVEMFLLKQDARAEPESEGTDSSEWFTCSSLLYFLCFFGLSSQPCGISIICCTALSVPQ